MFPGEEYAVPLALGLLGWYIFSRVRVPVAGILGPLVFIGVGASIGLPVANFPLWVKTGLQIVVGVYAGSRVTKEALATVRALGLTIAFVTAWTVLSAVAIGYFASRLTSVDLATTLLGSAPGGTAEMTAMALTVGASAPVVAVLHGFRLVATLGIVPLLASRRQLATARAGDGPPVGRLPLHLASALADGETEESTDRTRPAVWLAALLIGAAGALLCVAAGVPGGGVVGSLLAVALAASFLGTVGKPPVAVRSVAQLGVGVMVGGSLNPQAAQALFGALPVVAGITTATLASSLVLANFVERRLGTGRSTALLACAPGGLTQMPIVADELGADLAQVTIFQLTRFVCSIVVLPVLFRLLL